MILDGLKAYAAAALTVMLSGCAMVPAGTAINACNYLDTAVREADMAEAWYIGAGKVLEACGVEDAKEVAQWKACHARRRDDNSVVCE